MATRRTHRRNEAQLAFEALSIKGSLLSPEWLARVAALSAGGQSEAEYRVPRGLNLRDEIGRYWRIAQAHWNDFSAGRVGGADASVLSERFVTVFLRDVLGFVSLAPTAPPFEIAGRSYPIGHLALGTRVPIVVAPSASGLETLSATFGDGGRRRHAFGLAQEFLNASEDALWGIACDGVTLRVLRDNGSLTRPAWIEADLLRIFTEERYADFAALWLLAHETRFGSGDRPPTDCALEGWRTAGREEGTRALGNLRAGVQDALLALGQAFLHPDNEALHAALEAGSLTDQAYFQQLLRVVYRIIFLLTVEERGFLHPKSSTEASRALYAAGYSLHRLRERSVRRSAHDRYSDLWDALTIVFRGTARGEPRLGLPALAGLFAEQQCAILDASKVENQALLTAVFHLSWLREGTGISRVNWRDMGPEEFGSVYEGLLELVPQVTEGGRRFNFATGAATVGNARKLTGSYYTPASLVQVLLDNALEPVVQSTIAAHPINQVEALLGLTVVDPACGSGHFLLAAAWRIADHIARLRANGTPSTDEYQHALREVVGHCIYGVDLNEMAVELCKVSLWMEAVEPGRPLSFLDSHIQHGNSLLGTTPELMAKGVPDEAWEPIAGDEKKIASALKKQNKKERAELTLDFSAPPVSTYRRLGEGARAVDNARDEDLPSLESKGQGWQALVKSPAYTNARLAADLWCAAFVWRKEAGPLRDAAPTDAAFRSALKEPGRLSRAMQLEVERLRDAYQFFHWHLAFPQVFARGGFDVVLGNPPWDSMRFSEEEFFAGTRPEIASAPTAAARKRMVAKLEQEDAVLFRAYQDAFRLVEGANAFVRSGVPYPLCGVGRVNLFALFAETARGLVAKTGRVGQLLPSGIVADDSTKLFFQAIVETGQLVSFLDFENREGIFPSVHRSFKFGILTLSGASAARSAAAFVFFATRVEHLREPDRRFSLTADDIALLNPITKTCPVFRTRRDAELTKSVYRRLPVLTRSDWKLRLTRLINQSDDSGQFQNEAAVGLLPLYEGKYFHHYDHRWVTNDGDGDRELTDTERTDPNCHICPRYWYPAHDARERFGSEWRHPWVFAWRDIARSTDERTFISSVVPSLAVSNTAKVIFVEDSQLGALPVLIANLGTIAFDFVARQKIGGTHMSNFIVEQLPALTLETSFNPTPWAPDCAIRDWLFPRVLELTFTAWDLEPFARDIGYAGSPFHWEPVRRHLLRCELDAAFFYLYALSRDDTAYVLDTFPIVRRNEEKAHGSYRTKDVILEIYDAMAEAVKTNTPYVTRLDPAPADPRVAHPPRTDDPASVVRSKGVSS